MKTLAFYSIKGGVGKTAAVVNVAYLASQHMRTLVCDLDPQGAASYYFQVEPDDDLSKKTLLKGSNKLNGSIRETGFSGLDILPATMSFRNLDQLLGAKKRSKKRLRESLDVFKDTYECILIDSPPNITLLSENIFQACDRLIVPVIPTSLSLMTLQKLCAFYDDKGLDRNQILPFFSMVEKRKKLHRTIMQDISLQPVPFLTPHIPHNAEVEKMGLYRQPLVHKHPKARAANSFRALWKAIQYRSDETVISP